MGKGSFGHARFKLVKSTKTLHFLFFFFTTTVFASYSRKKASFIAPTFFNLLTSCLTALTYSLADLLGFYFLGENKGSTLSLWTINSGSTPGTSYGLQANTSTFCTSNYSISTLSSSFIPAPIWKLLSLSDSILTLIKSSAQLALIPSWGSCNCYKGTSLAGSICLISRLIAATKHCLATC